MLKVVDAASAAVLYKLVSDARALEREQRRDTEFVTECASKKAARRLRLDAFACRL
jgi:hypothetical protein